MSESNLTGRGGRRMLTVKRRAVGGSQSEWVKEGFLTEKSLPVVLRPAIDGLDLAAWAGNNRAFVEERLHLYGAVLFRGFDVRDAGAFERIIEAVSGAPVNYEEHTSPRSHVERGIYTSTEYPPEQTIFLHNENSYQHVWPMKFFLFCQTPARGGGETPLADCRKVFRHIDEKIRDVCARKRWMLVRNFGDGFGLTWQDAFYTHDRETVEDYCRRHRIEFEWKGGDRLRTKQVRPFFAGHPRTGDPVWFNHAAFFHLSALEPALRETLLAEFGEEDLPYNTYYGDGSPIEDSVVAELREAYRREKVSFPWQRGDVLLLDNMLTAHGREPFTGDRRVLVGMAELCSWDEL